MFQRRRTVGGADLDFDDSSDSSSGDSPFRSPDDTSAVAPPAAPPGLVLSKGTVVPLNPPRQRLSIIPTKAAQDAARRASAADAKAHEAAMAAAAVAAAETAMKTSLLTRAKLDAVASEAIRTVPSDGGSDDTSSSGSEMAEFAVVGLAPTGQQLASPDQETASGGPISRGSSEYMGAGDDDDDDGDDDDADFAVAGDDEDFSVNEIERERRKLAEAAELHRDFAEWDALDLREKLFSIVEPSAVTVEQPPTYALVSRVYIGLYFALTCLHIVALVLQTFKTGLGLSKATVDLVFMATTGFLVIDLLLRSASCTQLDKVPMIVVDFSCLVAAAMLIINGPLAYDVWAFIVQLRALRLFLITRLFLHTDTFRDVNLAFTTVERSAKSMSVFFVLMIVGLFVFSTFVYILERGRFDEERERWIRPCKDFGGCKEEVSPFQSIPDAMWLIINSMTTVGLGDVIPATTAGRVVTGVAMIAGVFVIAFPTMVLVGNLSLVRKNFWKEEERALRKLEDEELARLEAVRLAALQMQRMQSRGGVSRSSSNPSSRPTTMGASMSAAGSVNFAGGANSVLGAALSDLAGGVVTSMSLNSDSGLVGLLSRKMLKKQAFFAFMGNPRREVRATRNANEFRYRPILETMNDADGLPMLTCISKLSEYSYTAQLVLVLDDIAAQEAAVGAIVRASGLADSGGIHARATGIFGLEVTLVSHVAGARLRRRVDIGEVRDNTVPIVLSVTVGPRHSVASHAEALRKLLVGAQLRVSWCPTACSSGTWRRLVHITSAMLAESPFCTDLKAISVHVSNDQLWPNPKGSLKKMNPAHFKRRDLAFVAETHLEFLLRPLFDKLATRQYCVRNFSEVMRELIAIILLHCRHLHFQDVPSAVHHAVYMSSELQPYDRVFEVDVDFFRLVDWPLGMIEVEFSERKKRIEQTVSVGAVGACGPGQQPTIFDLENFKQPFEQEAAMNATEKQDEHWEKLKEEAESHAKNPLLVLRAMQESPTAMRGDHFAIPLGEEAAEGGEAMPTGDNWDIDEDEE